MADPEVPAVETANADPAAPAPAPVQDEPVVSAESSAPAENAATAPAIEEPEEKPSKVVSELIAQRKKRQDAEKEAAYWRGIAEGRAKEPAAPAPSEGPKIPVAPKLDQFETYDQYEAAKDAYLIDKAKHDFRMEQQIEQQRQVAATTERTFMQRMDAAVKEDPALLDILRDGTLPVSEAMIPVLKESETAPQIFRWLNQNRSEAARIAQLPPLQAARALGIVEAQIKFTPKAEPARTVSAAPEPIATVSSTSPGTIDEDSLSMEEYHKRRTQQLYGPRQ